ncbi:unnamed protein product [Linum trigynum]|uniref:SAM domain-containing protein n=1 Tax=Linum trigynum TaxID=586398 RepID=A0AAV2DEN0_9ROSI
MGRTRRILNDLDGEDDSWVIVKRQRVTIYIPPPPDAEKPPPVLPSPAPTSEKATPAEIVNAGESTDAACARISPEEADVVRMDHGRAGTTATMVGVSRTSRNVKQPRLFLPRQSIFDSGAALNQTLRASLVERKIEKAGGLSNWLASLGLGQFVRIFRDRSVGKFQLVNLTMKKLKDMGADAVGPRRKLMHAIDCICQPYCFGSK